MAKAPTAPYPDNPRSEWFVDWIERPTYRSDGLLAFEYAVYANERSRAAKDDPFLLNSHLAMVRETHQRIRTDTSGSLLHASGLTVKPEDVEEFLATDPRATVTGLDPFVFPTYSGVLEGLDPQWLRELYLLPQEGQVDELIERYLKGAEARRLSGDHRGTTLDLQVGASEDDIWHRPHTINKTSNDYLIGKIGFTPYDSVARFINVTIPQGDTIDVAYLTLIVRTSSSGTTVLSDVSLEDTDDSGQIADDADYHSRVQTAVVAWDDIPAWTDGETKNSPSLVTPIQTVINRGGFSSGNALGVRWADGGSDADVDAYRIGSSYNHDSAEAPQLHIEHSAGGGGDSIPGTLAYQQARVFLLGV